MYGLPLSEIVLPMMSGSLSKRRAQTRWLRTTTLSPSGGPLRRVNVRPLSDRRAEQLEEVGGHPARAKLLGKRAARVVDDAGVEGRDVLHDLRTARGSA